VLAFELVLVLELVQFEEQAIELVLAFELVLVLEQVQLEELAFELVLVLELEQLEEQPRGKEKRHSFWYYHEKHSFHRNIV